MISSPFFLPVKNDFFKQQFVMKKSVIFEHIQKLYDTSSTILWVRVHQNTCSLFNNTHYAIIH